MSAKNFTLSLHLCMNVVVNCKFESPIDRFDFSTSSLVLLVIFRFRVLSIVIVTHLAHFILAFIDKVLPYFSHAYFPIVEVKCLQVLYQFLGISVRFGY